MNSGLRLLIGIGCLSPLTAGAWEAPTFQGKAGLIVERTLEADQERFERLYTHLSLTGSIPFEVDQRPREILYNLGVRGWLTRKAPEPTLDPLTGLPAAEEKTTAPSVKAEALLERATLEYNRKRWKFRLGQQELALGEVLGPSVIDLANARDYRQPDQFLKSSERLPQLMGTIDYKRKKYGFKLFVSPYPTQMKLPESIQHIPLISVPNAHDPEFGGRYNLFWNGLDLKFYALHHQNRSPILVQDFSDQGPQLLALQRYENSVASTFNYAWDYTVLRGEIVRTQAQKNDARDLTASTVDQAVLALDFTSEDQLLLVGQVQSIAPSQCSISLRCSQKQFWAGGQIQKPWFSDILKTNLFFYRRTDQNIVYRKAEIEIDSTLWLLLKLSYEDYDGFGRDGLDFLDHQDRFRVDLQVPF